MHTTYGDGHLLKRILNCEPLVHDLPVLKVLAIQQGTFRQKGRRDDHRVADRVSVLVGNQHPRVECLKGQGNHPAHRSNRFEHLQRLDPGHPELAAADRTELVEDLNADDAAALQEERMYPVGFRCVGRKQVEQDVGVEERASHARWLRDD